jgi:hypothetical protein
MTSRQLKFLQSLDVDVINWPSVESLCRQQYGRLIPSKVATIIVDHLRQRIQWFNAQSQHEFQQTVYAYVLNLYREWRLRPQTPRR